MISLKTHTIVLLCVLGFSGQNAFAKSKDKTATAESSVVSYKMDSKRTKEKKDNVKFKLVFEDNFNKNKYNTKFWSSYPVQNNKSPWNKYVVDDATLAEVKKGNLFLRARWNPTTNLPETGAIQTKNKFSFKYGKIEVRAKFNKSGQGGWPAIWLMPQNPIFPSWPSGGELDIMERLNNDNFVHQVVHQTDGDAKQIAAEKTPLISTAEYNTYSLVKLPNRIEFYVNDQLTLVHEPKDDFAKRWPFETDYYIILNYACADQGQSGVKFWPGYVTSTDGFPYEMAVDYVKVWKVLD